MNAVTTFSGRMAFALIRRPAVPVRFEGAGTRRGPLTLGQLNIFQWLAGEPDHVYASIGCALDLPPRIPMADVVESLSVLLNRHEGLRTRFILDGRPQQSVLASGTFPLDVYEIDADDPAALDRDALIAETGRRLTADSAAEPGELPWRAAVAVKSGIVYGGVIGYSHLAADDRAMTLLGREIADMVRNPAARTVGPPRHQPLDQVELERERQLRERAEKALSYWQTYLERMPPNLYAAPRSAPAEASTVVTMSSPAAALALRSVAARIRTSRSSVVLAAVCAVLAQRTGYRELIFPILAGNRSERHLSNFIGTLAQSSIVAVDTAAPSFDQLVGRAWAATVQAGRHGMYDVYRRVELAARTERHRGVRFTFEPLFNSTVFDGNTSSNDRSLPDIGDGAASDDTPAPSATAEPRPRTPQPRSDTRLRREPGPPASAAIRFDVYRFDDELQLNIRVGDVTRTTADEAESLLLAIERLLLAAAGADLGADRVRDVIALPPITRGPGWLLVDSCWIELAEAQSLVAQALAPAACRVFAESTDGATALVAYVAFDNADAPPSFRQLHDRCLAALAGRPTAIAPHKYVLCDQAPADPDDLAGWRRMARREGTGRPTSAGLTVERP